MAFREPSTSALQFTYFAQMLINIENRGTVQGSPIVGQHQTQHTFLINQQVEKAHFLKYENRWSCDQPQLKCLIHSCTAI